MRAPFFLFAAAVLCSGSNASETRAAINPIRKVVNLLQQMVKHVEEEGEKEEELFNKFMCYCKTGGKQLADSIAAAETKMPEVASSIEEATSKETQLKEDLTQHKADRDAAKKAMAEATAIREKEAKTYAKYKSDQDADIAAMGGAIVAIEKGMGEFLQMKEAASLKKVVLSKREIPDVDRQDLLAFLSGKNTDGYAPASGQIVGILKQLKERTEKDLADATEEEAGSIKDFDGLMVAKKKETQALTDSIESKTQRVGELAVEIVELKDDLGDTGKTLDEDKKFLANLDKNCATKTKEWQKIQKTRAEELVALGETIKVLNDDDALDLFKKTLPSASASFVQIRVTEKSMQDRVLSLVKDAQKKAHVPRPQMDFIALALHGKKVNFETVLKMIDKMVQVLKDEQQSDDDEKKFCNDEFDAKDDAKKMLDRKVSDAKTAIEDAKENIATLKGEIEALNAGIKALDKDVAEATVQRKAESDEFKELMMSDGAAKKLLGFAKNRLNKFYNPKLYKETTPAPLSEEDQIVQNMGGTLEPTAAPGGIAGTGISAFVQVRAHQDREDPGPAPEAPGPYKKKSGQSTGVIAMIDLLIADLDKEMTEAETNEKDNQADYEKLMEDSASKRQLDSKSLADKAGTKAELEGKLEEYTEEKKANERELAAVLEAIASLHGQCDFLLKYYDARKEARAGEVDSLKTAKAVLSGADFSLLQKRVVRSLRR